MCLAYCIQTLAPSVLYRLMLHRHTPALLGPCRAINPDNYHRVFSIWEPCSLWFCWPGLIPLGRSFLFSHTRRLADRANQILLAIDPEKLEGDESSLLTDVIMCGVAAWVPEQPARLWQRVNLSLKNSRASHLSVVPTSHLLVDAGIILTV